MKQTVFLVILLFAGFIKAGAQIKDFDVKPAPAAGCKAVYLSCDDVKYGVIVLQSLIGDLEIRMSPANKLKNPGVYDPQCKEYVLCVDPTMTDEYRIEITHPQFATKYHFVSEILPNRPQIYRVNAFESKVGVDDLMVLGDNHFANGRFAEAESRYREAYKIDSNDASVLYKLGETCFNQGKFAEAEEFMKKTISLRANAETHYFLGRIYYAQSKYDEAAFSFVNAVNLSSNKIYNDALLDALSKSPTEAMTNAKIGDTRFAQGNYKEALVYFNKAASIDPSNREYPIKIRTTNTRIRQQEYFTAANNLLRIAQNTPKPVYSGTNDNTFQQRRNAYLELYKKPLAEVEKAKELGELPKDLQETAAGYEFLYYWETYNGDLSTAYKQDYIKKYPNTPYRILICGEDGRGCIEKGGGGIKVKHKIFRPSIGVGVVNMGALDLFGYQANIGLRIFDSESLVNFHVGIQFAYYASHIYNTSDGGSKPTNDKTWDVEAGQLSLPATLQLNLFKSKNSISPWAVYIAGTGQFNYNIDASFFGKKSSDFVNQTGISALYSIGYTNNSFSFSIYCRQNFNDLFIRNNIMKYDNKNSYNDYKKLDRIMQNNLLFGAALTYYH